MDGDILGASSWVQRNGECKWEWQSGRGPPNYSSSTATTAAAATTTSATQDHYIHIVFRPSLFFFVPPPLFCLSRCDLSSVAAGAGFAKQSQTNWKVCIISFMFFLRILKWVAVVSLSEGHWWILRRDNDEDEGEGAKIRRGGGVGSSSSSPGAPTNEERYNMPLLPLLLLSRRHLLPHSVLPACMHLNLFLFDNHCMEALMYEYKFEETRLFKYIRKYRRSRGPCHEGLFVQRVSQSLIEGAIKQPTWKQFQDNADICVVHL